MIALKLEVEKIQYVHGGSVVSCVKVQSRLIPYGHLERYEPSLLSDQSHKKRCGSTIISLKIEVKEFQ